MVGGGWRTLSGIAFCGLRTRALGCLNCNALKVLAEGSASTCPPARDAATGNGFLAVLNKAVIRDDRFDQFGGCEVEGSYLDFLKTLDFEDRGTLRGSKLGRSLCQRVLSGPFTFQKSAGEAV